MRAVVTLAPGQMEVRDVEPPQPAPGAVLLKVEGVGLCGSDFHLFTGHHPYAHFPQVQGHEAVARVADDGGRAQELSVGDLVVFEPLKPCGHCYPCRRGRYNCCVDLLVMGAHIPGALQEYVAVDANRVFAVGDLAALTAVLVEPVTIGLQCVVRADVQRGNKVVVIGAGPVGLAATLGAVDRGAEVLVVDQQVNRLGRARSLGAAAAVNTAHEDLQAAVEKFTDGDGAAVVVEATGVPALLSAALDLVAHSGTVVVVGISDGAVEIPVGYFSRKEINLLGSRNNTGLFPAAIDLVRRYARELAPIVTHTFPLEDAPRGLDFAMTNPDVVEKAVIVFETSPS